MQQTPLHIEPAPMELTLAIVKPDAVARNLARDILERAELSGLEVVREREMTLSRETAEALYAEHIGKDHFERIVTNLCSGPVVAAILRGRHAVARWRELLGPTDPQKAPAGTIRGDFGTILPSNSAHGSDGASSAQREIEVLFPEVRLVSRSA